MDALHRRVAQMHRNLRPFYCFRRGPLVARYIQDCLMLGKSYTNRGAEVHCAGKFCVFVSG